PAVRGGARSSAIRGWSGTSNGIGEGLRKPPERGKTTLHFPPPLSRARPELPRVTRFAWPNPTAAHSGRGRNRQNGHGVRESATTLSRIEARRHSASATPR